MRTIHDTNVTSLSEYLADAIDNGFADRDRGDVTDPLGYIAQVGSRIYMRDEFGRVTVHRMADAYSAEVVIAAYDDVEHLQWGDQDDADDAALYLGYALACGREGLAPHGFHMWRVHGRPLRPV